MQYYSETSQGSDYHHLPRSHPQIQNFENDRHGNNFYDPPQNAQLNYTQSRDIYSHSNEHYTNQSYPQEQIMARSSKPNQSYAPDSYGIPTNHSRHQEYQYNSNMPMQVSQFPDSHHQYGNNEQDYLYQQSCEAVPQHLQQVQIRDDYQQPHYNESQKHSINFKNESNMAEPWPNRQDQSFNKHYVDREVGSRQLEQQPLFYQPKTYGEPIRLHEIGKPQVLAKSSGDGDAVAVFGVVAQVEKSPTSQYPPTSNQFVADNKQRSDVVQSPSYGSSNRSHHLTPIMEQPTQPSVLPQNYRNSDFNYNNQQQNFSRGRSDNRNSIQFSKPDSNEFMQRNRVSGDFERHQTHRDEYTDSGYGSTLTERSYDGPMKNQVHFRPDHRENRSPDRSTQQQWQKPSYTQPIRPDYHQSSYNERPPNQHDDMQQRNRNIQRPRENRVANQSYTTNQQHHGGVDEHQARIVSSMKKMFDQPGKIPLPPASTGYGANQYSSDNARQIPLRPRVPSSENRYQSEQRSLSEQNYQSNSPPYHSYDHVPQQSSQKHISGPPHSSYDQHGRPSRNLELSAQNARSSQHFPESKSPPGQTSHQYRGYAEKPSLPHFQPPPQHSRSMNNLDDLQPQEIRSKPSQNSRSRNSYTHEQDNDMVIGVRFEKRSTKQHQREEHQSALSLSPTSYELSNPAERKNISDNEPMRFPEVHQPPQSFSTRLSQDYQQSSQNYREDGRSQQTTSYSQSRPNFPPEGNHSSFVQPMYNYAPEESRLQTHSYEQPQSNYIPPATRHPPPSGPSYDQEESRPPPTQSQSRSRQPPFGSISPPSRLKPVYIHEDRRPPPPSKPPITYVAEESEPPQSYSRTNFPSTEIRSPPHFQSRKDYIPEEERHFQSYSRPSDNNAPEESRPVPSQFQPRIKYVPQEDRPPQSHYQPKDSCASEEAKPPIHSQTQINYGPEETRPTHSQQRVSHAPSESRHSQSHSRPSDGYAAKERRTHPAHSQPHNNHAHAENRPPHSRTHLRDSYATEKSRPPVSHPRVDYVPEESTSPPLHSQPQNYEKPRQIIKSTSPEFLLQQERPSGHEQTDHRSQSEPYEQSRERPGYRRQTEETHDPPEEENYVPDVVKKSYGMFSQSKAENMRSQASEEWPEPPSIADPNSYQDPDTYETRIASQTEPVQQPQSYSTASNRHQFDDRLQPRGGYSKQASYRQIPRHPFDPDDDSSEEVDVDAPTPPPSNKQKQRSNFLYSNTPVASASHPQQQPTTTGEQHHPDTRQSGDGLNEDRYSSSRVSFQQTSNASRPIAPKKPSRSSLKQKEASNTAQNDLLTPDSFFDDSTSAPLNHKHSKDRARIAQAGKVTKKPPNRSHSSAMLAEEPDQDSNYEINVTSNDLFHLQAAQAITVHKPDRDCKLKEKKQETSHSSRSLNEATQTEIPSKPQAPSKVEVSKKTKLIFKPAPENAIKQDHRLPDVKEPFNGNKKMPPTYTELLGQFKSHRENAIRSAAEKHDRALKTAQAAARGSNSSKRNENRDIYNQSKPKLNRDDCRDNRGQSSGRTKTRSPERHERSHDRHDIDERRDRSKENFDRDRRPRKSERGKEQRSDRVVSPHKGGKDEDPYRHSHRHRRDEPHSHSRNRNGEPEWVEQYRRRRAGNEESPNRRETSEDQRRRQKKEFDFDQYQRDVKHAVSYNSDFDQPPVRKQLLPTKLMAKGQSKPDQRPPQGNSDWMKNLKEQNRRANRNRNELYGFCVYCGKFFN